MSEVLTLDLCEEHRIKRAGQPGTTSLTKTLLSSVGLCLVVSLRGVNFGIWSHLGCSEKTLLYLVMKVLFTVTRRNIKIYICLLSNMVSFRGQKKLGSCPDQSPLGD